MIIVKTNTGTHFVTDKETHIVQHEKEKKMVAIRSPKEGLNCNINNVTEVIFVSDAKAIEFHDDGKVIEDMKAKINQMEAASLATILKTESECNAKIEKAEAENADLKKENEKLQDWVVRLQKKLRDFGCEL